MRTRHTGKPTQIRLHIPQLPRNRHRLAITPPILKLVAPRRTHRLISIVQCVARRPLHSAKHRTTTRAIPAGSHPVQPMHHNWMGNHPPERIAIRRGQIHQPRQQRPPRPGLTLRPSRQFCTNLNPILEFIHRLIRLFQPFLVHHPAHHQIPIQIPKIKFLLINF